MFELCLRADTETLLLPIYDEENPDPDGNALASIKKVKTFPQVTIELDTHAVISNTRSLTFPTSTLSKSRKNTAFYVKNIMNTIPT